MKILGIVIFIFLAACTRDPGPKPVSAPPQKVAPDWKACQKSSDCVQVDDRCGSKAAINKKFLKEYQEQLASTKATCPDGGARKQKRHSVDCVAESCTLLGD